MLVYHPYNDTYHCLFRLMLLLDKLPNTEYEIEKIKILCFYILFPNMLKKIKLPNDFRLYRRYIDSIQEPYAMMIDTKRILEYVDSQVDYCLRYMASSLMIDIEYLKKSLVIKKDNDKYQLFINKDTIYDEELLGFLVDVISQIPLKGKNGLKARTNLYEYRYDNE